ncbi:MAG: hypothetical protein IPG76_20225 [Acidobacteria bacterium]|nr:hypothetical protein [Acidobacteriota bacterium]
MALDSVTITLKIWQLDLERFTRPATSPFSFPPEYTICRICHRMSRG